MLPIRFEPLNRRNLREFVRLTRETLWMPADPGETALRRAVEHLSPPERRGARLIYEGPEPVGRIVAPQIDDILLARDLGLLPRFGLADQVARALWEHAHADGVRVLRAIVHETVWDALAALGLQEWKRRLTMRRDLRKPPLAFGAGNLRAVTERDLSPIADLLDAAYAGTVDGIDGDLEGWTFHARDIFRGHFGTFLPPASFVTPPDPPFHSASLVVEQAAGSAVLGQAVTRPEYANRGHARRLISHSLAALSRMGYDSCFLEVTLSNVNALHLYSALGFQPIGPQIVYGECTLS